MEWPCPGCKTLLQIGAADDVHCNICQQEFRLEARCPECHNLLEVLKACGVVDYFCQNGHGLISRKRIEYVLQKKGEFR